MCKDLCSMSSFTLNQSRMSVAWEGLWLVEYCVGRFSSSWCTCWQRTTVSSASWLCVWWNSWHFVKRCSLLNVIVNLSACNGSLSCQLEKFGMASCLLILLSRLSGAPDWTPHIQAWHLLYLVSVTTGWSTVELGIVKIWEICEMNRNDFLCRLSLKLHPIFYSQIAEKKGNLCTAY